MFKKMGTLAAITILCLFLSGCSLKEEVEKRRIEFFEFRITLLKHNILIEKQNIILDKIYTLLKNKYDEEEAQKKRWGIK
jgi:hypothetical protein